MKRLLIALAVIALLSPIAALRSQQWLSGAQGVPIVCAYNSSPPTVTSGNFVYANCTNSGTILTSGGGGGGGGTSSNFGAAFPSSGTAAGAEYLTSPPTLTSGQMVALQTDINGNLKVSGLSGSVSNSASGVTTSSSNIGAASWLYGFNGTTWDQLRSTGSPNFALTIDDVATSNQLHTDLTSPPNVTVNGSSAALTGLTPGSAQTGTIVALNTDLTSAHGTALGTPVAWGSTPSGVVLSANVDCVAGCAGGSTSNASSGVATSSTNGATVAWTYGFNGTTWDQLQVDGSKNLKVTGVGIAQASTTSGQTGSLVMGAVTTGAPTYTTAQSDPLSLDTAGNLRVNVVAGGGTGGTSAADATAWTAGTTAMTAVGCEFTTGGATAIVTAHMGTVGCTAARAQLTDKSSVSGTALTAAVSAYGTAPTGTAVEGVNAFVTNANANGATSTANSSPVTEPILAHASTTALGTSLVVKASAGDLGAYNCTGIAGAAAGFCIAYNGTTAPSTGALTGANVLDFCYFDATARGCSLSRLPNSVAYSTGIVILISSAASPYTYTTGTDTGGITADYF